MIHLADVKKTYRGRFALDIPSLSIEEGKRYALIGTNGSGKSTLLNLLAGTLKPDAGKIAIPDALFRCLGFMPQNPYAYSFSVLNNVCIACNDKRDAKSRALMALEQIGLSKLASAKGDSLSGGETQRMAFARMIVIERKLLLLDEPTSATDIAGNSIVETALTQYLNKTGCTLVFSTHSLAQAERLADEAIFLNDGRVAEQGSLAEVFYYPKSEEARVFLKYWQLNREGGGKCST